MEKWLLDALGQGGAPERPSSCPPMQQQAPLVQYDPSYMFGGYGAYRPSWGTGMVKSMSSHQLSASAQPVVPQRPMLKSKSSHQLSTLNELDGESDYINSGPGSPSSAITEGHLKPLDLAQPQSTPSSQQQQKQQPRRHWPFIGLAAA